ncbi:hypothetical protein [uncultured Boseongicola sp.]|uniref:hypothetical protein n=1 Tax=uncultured Boseongicola sp. TaxID=1648499 RepID=UPI00261FAE22|nr:hypothetical protein [uncultured Boseongicola sp.]
MHDRSLGWYYWLATVPLLIIGIFFTSLGIWAAIGLTALQAMHFYAREKAVSAFPVQVRLAYVLLLVMGLWAPLVFIHWIQLVGTIALVTVGYCPLARFLSLMPWNRQTPVTWAAIKETILIPPVKGSIKTHFAQAASEKPLE